MSLQNANNLKNGQGLGVEAVQINRVWDSAFLLDHFIDPDEVLRKAGKTLSAYRSLLTDPHVFACLSSRFAGTELKEFRITTAGKTSADRNARDFIAEVFTALDVNTLKRQILSAKLFGYSVSEIYYRPERGYWMPTAVVEKPQEWFGFNSARELVFYPTASLAGEKLDTASKFFLVQNEPTFTNPFGSKLLARVFWPVMFQKGGWEFWMEFAEKFGQAFIIGKYPSTWNTADPAQRAKIDELLLSLAGLIGSATAAVPSDTEITIADHAQKSATGGLHEAIIHRAESEISKVILGSTLTAQEGQNGTQSLGRVHFDVREEIIQSDMRFQKVALDRLIRMIVSPNFDVSVYPVFEHYEEDDLSAGRAERDNHLYAQGLRFTRLYYQNRYGFAPEEIAVAEPVAPAPALQAEPEPAVAEFAESSSRTDLADDGHEALYQGILSKLILLSEEAGERKFSALTVHLKKSMKNAGSFETLAETLMTSAAAVPDETDATEARLFGAANVLAALRVVDNQNRETKKTLLFAEGDGVFEFLREFDRRLNGAKTGLTDAELAELAEIASSGLDTIWSSRLALDPDEYSRLIQDARRRAFTVGGDYSRDAVQKVYNSLYAAWKEGKDYTVWKDEYLGELELTPLLRDSQARAVYRENLTNTYNAEMWRRQKDTAALFPYLRYNAVLDNGTSAICRELHGTVARVNDPFWDTYYPPNHFGCRSVVSQLTDEEADRYRTRDPEYKTPDKVSVAPYRSKDGKYDFSGNPGTVFFGRASGDNDFYKQSALIDAEKYKLNLSELSSGEALDYREVFNNPEEIRKKSFLKGVLKGLIKETYTDANPAWGETWVLNAKSNREILLSYKNLVAHNTNEEGKERSGHYEAWPYLGEALANPSAVFFEPALMRSGQVFFQYHYIANGVVPSKGKFQNLPVHVVVRFWDKRFRVITAFIEGKNKKAEGILEL